MIRSLRFQADFMEAIRKGQVDRETFTKYQSTFAHELSQSMTSMYSEMGFTPEQVDQIMSQATEIAEKILSSDDVWIGFRSGELVTAGEINSMIAKDFQEKVGDIMKRLISDSSDGEDGFLPEDNWNPQHDPDGPPWYRGPADPDSPDYRIDPNEGGEE